MNHTTKPITFTKMHGLGNDFVIINTLNQSIDIAKLAITQLADRHRGIGFDQLILIEASEQADFFCRIYNADGTEAEQCGNGLRCVARLLHEEKWHAGTAFSLETKAGIFPLTIKDYDHIQIAMGAPSIQENLTTLTIASNPVALSILSLGNPHAIVKIDSVDQVAAEQLGAAIGTHSYFAEGANVGFMEVIDPEHVRLRTYERGAGETNACGSNACAAVVAGIANGWLAERVRVAFKYGTLLIEWRGPNTPILMTGPATNLFSGQLINYQ